MLLSTTISVLALVAAKASAHGAVTSYVIGSTTYPGYEGFSPASSPATIQRQWPDYNPILSVTDAKMTCNEGTSAALAGAFTTCTGKDKSWFKIDQMSLTPGSALTSIAWGAAQVMAKLAWKSTIPKDLAPGNYLIRYELLALHQSNTPQFYPECAQLIVTGSGTQTPSGSYLTSIPGYATAADPDVLIDIYSSKATTYTCPGPAVWTVTGATAKRFEA